MEIVMDEVMTAAESDMAVIVKMNMRDPLGPGNRERMIFIFH